MLTNLRSRFSAHLGRGSAFLLGTLVSTVVAALVTHYMSHWEEPDINVRLGWGYAVTTRGSIEGKNVNPTRSFFISFIEDPTGYKAGLSHVLPWTTGIVFDESSGFTYDDSLESGLGKFIILNEGRSTAENLVLTIEAPRDMVEWQVNASPNLVVSTQELRPNAELTGSLRLEIKSLAPNESGVVTLLWRRKKGSDKASTEPLIGEKPTSPEQWAVSVSTPKGNSRVEPVLLADAVRLEKELFQQSRFVYWPAKLSIKPGAKARTIKLEATIDFVDGKDKVGTVMVPNNDQIGDPEVIIRAAK